MVPGIKDRFLSDAASTPMRGTSRTTWGDPKGSFREGSLGCGVAAAD